MKTGQLYIALSEELNHWAQDEGHLYLFKIGTTSEPAQRLHALNHGWPNDPQSGPCLGFTDWRWAERWHYRARAAANNDEKRLKEFLENRWRVFDRTLSPGYDPRRANGATEVYQIKQAELPDLDELTMPQGSGYSNRVNAMVLAAVGRHLRSELERLFPMVDPEEVDLLDNPELDDLDEPDLDLLDQAAEEAELAQDEFVEELMSSQDNFVRSDEDGWLYRDDE